MNGKDLEFPGRAALQGLPDRACSEGNTATGMCLRPVRKSKKATHCVCAF